MSHHDFATPEQMRSQNFYKRLNIEQGATDEEIERAYQQQRERYREFIQQHPTYTACYYLLEEAYTHLKDPEFRKSFEAAEKEMARQQQAKKPRTLPTRKHVLQWLLAFLICNTIVSFIAYSSPPPGESAIMTGVFCGGLAFPIIVLFLKHGKRWDALFLLVLAVTLCSNVAFFFTNYQKHKLYLDNQNEFEVLIRIDGETFATLPAHGFVLKSLRIGDHRIESYKMPGDSLLESFDAKVESRNRYMYNVLSSGKYISGTQGYSETALLDYLNGVSAPDYPMYTIGDRWMLMNYDYIFTKPPNEITVKKNLMDFDKQTAERDYIIRAESTDDQYW